MTATKPHTVYVVGTNDGLGTLVERAFANLPAARAYIDNAHGAGPEIRVSLHCWKRSVDGYEVWIHRLRVYEGAKT